MQNVLCIPSVAIALSSSLLCNNELSHLFLCVCVCVCVCVCDMIKKENTMVDYNIKKT